MRLVIAGANGQLGHALSRQGVDHELLATDQYELDITDAEAVKAGIKGFRPDAVINAAAYTAVDKAESDAESAFAVNRDGPKNLAISCEEMGIPLIHISTDYVFDGSKQGAYIESDPTAPLSVYGASKLAGELAVQENCSRHIILRTSWVFSSHGNNFVKTMLRLGSERETLGIVADQHGCPTAAVELARAIYAVLDQKPTGSTWGMYHFCQPEPTTWFKFAEAIFAEARAQGMDMKVSAINALDTSDYPTPAKRPVNSTMSCAKFESNFNFIIRPWLHSLPEIIRELS